MIRTAVVGCSHWHLDLYLDPLLRSPDANVVAVSDPDRACADAVAARAGGDAYTDYRDLCARAKPDLVVALGRHSDMAKTARFLLEEGIPFAMEKPCGLTEAEVAPLAGLAAARGSFAGVRRRVHDQPGRAPRGPAALFDRRGRRAHVGRDVE